MKVVFDNLANFLSTSPNQTPAFDVCLPGPSWTFLPFLCLLILYSLPYMYTLYNIHVFTPTWTVQYVISCAVNIWLQLYTCFLTMRSKHASSKILNNIGRNSLLGNRKKIAKFLMRTFTCRSTLLYGKVIRTGVPGLLNYDFQLLVYSQCSQYTVDGRVAYFSRTMPSLSTMPKLTKDKSNLSQRNLS